MNLKPEKECAMKSKGNGMGRFSVDLEITNNSDLVLAAHGHLDPSRIRRTVIAGVVDPGATKLVLPEALAGPQVPVVDVLVRRVRCHQKRMPCLSAGT